MGYTPLSEILMMDGHKSGGLFRSMLRIYKGYSFLFSQCAWLAPPGSPTNQSTHQAYYLSVSTVASGIMIRWGTGGEQAMHIG